MGSVMEYCDNRSQHQREETIQKEKKKRSAEDDDDELPQSKQLGSSEDGFVCSTRRVTRSASKQQQHGEAKEQKKPVSGLRWREFTDEELEAHKKKAEESEGFDVGEVPEDVFMNIILPCELDGPASELRPYNIMAKKALATYNKEKAKDKKTGSQNFQTAVASYRDLIDVVFCRVEKKLEEPKGLRAGVDLEEKERTKSDFPKKDSPEVAKEIGSFVLIQHLVPNCWL